MHRKLIVPNHVILTIVNAAGLSLAFLAMANYSVKMGCHGCIEIGNIKIHIVGL